MLALEQSLKAGGNEVAVFAMQHPENQPSAWQEYWPENVEYGARLGMAASARAAVRTTYSWSVADRLQRLISEFRPNVAHLHSVHHHLTVSVVDALWRAGVPAVWTLHDYRVVCPATHLLRGNRPCTLCAWPVLELRRAQLQGSVAYALAVRERRARISIPRVAYKVTGLLHFAAPSGFLARRSPFGIPRRKVTFIPNPPEATEWAQAATVARPGALYVGHLSFEKGRDGRLGPWPSWAEASSVVGGGPDRARLEGSRRKSWRSRALHRPARPNAVPAKLATELPSCGAVGLVRELPVQRDGGPKTPMPAAGWVASNSGTRCPSWSATAETACTFTPRDPSALAEAMRIAVEDDPELLARLASRVRSPGERGVRARMEAVITLRGA